MNRDSLAALGRAAIAVVAGGLLLYAIGNWLGWWWVAGVAVYAAAEFAWCTWQIARQLPRTWRSW